MTRAKRIAPSRRLLARVLYSTTSLAAKGMLAVSFLAAPAPTGLPMVKGWVATSQADARERAKIGILARMFRGNDDGTPDQGGNNDDDPPGDDDQDDDDGTPDQGPGDVGDDDDNDADDDDGTPNQGPGDADGEHDAGDDHGGDHHGGDDHGGRGGNSGPGRGGDNHGGHGGSGRH